MSMCCALLYLIAKMNENEATADYQKDTVMVQICSHDVDAAVVHLHRHSQPFNAFERPMKSSSYALYDELVDIMSCDPH
jgi:hypothetical protein